MAMVNAYSNDLLNFNIKSSNALITNPLHGIIDDHENFGKFVTNICSWNEKPITGSIPEP